MNDLEKMIMQEISTLNEMRLIDVLGFIRYLKEQKPVKQEWVEKWFEQALKSVHSREKELRITPADIQAQIKKNRKSQ
ncbi:MAG: hypothetical protein DPW18_08885 [Chloroflexi bacterium]|nr:hypothetical protein [Chloroflexota bacterium]MDL1943795.1 hypothetical protein [Chloroflexi bacterium CFX2]